VNDILADKMSMQLDAQISSAVRVYPAADNEIAAQGNQPHFRASVCYEDSYRPAAYPDKKSLFAEL
jgi:hypothetical protein